MLQGQDDDPTLALKIGEERFANRSILLRPDGSIATTYDKIHMFDVELGGGESYRESAAFRPGDRAVVADTELGCIGMSVCYDLRFARLYRDLAKAGAQILTIPAASAGPSRRTFGHSLAISPWGEVLADAGTEPGVTLVDLDLAEVAEQGFFKFQLGAVDPQHLAVRPR